MHSLTGGHWKRAGTCGNAPVPDPPHSCCDLGRSGKTGSIEVAAWRSCVCDGNKIEAAATAGIDAGLGRTGAARHCRGAGRLAGPVPACVTVPVRLWCRLRVGPPPDQSAQPRGEWTSGPRWSRSRTASSQPGRKPGLSSHQVAPASR